MRTLHLVFVVTVCLLVSAIVLTPAPAQQCTIVGSTIHCPPVIHSPVLPSRIIRHHTPAPVTIVRETPVVREVVKEIAVPIAVPVIVPATVFQYLPALAPTAPVAVAPAIVPAVAAPAAAPAAAAAAARAPSNAELDTLIRTRLDALLKEKLDQDSPPPIAFAPASAGTPPVPPAQPAAAQPAAAQPAAAQPAASAKSAAWASGLKSACIACHQQGGTTSGRVQLFDTAGNFAPNVNELQIAESIISGRMPRGTTLDMNTKLLLLQGFSRGGV